MHFKVSDAMTTVRACIVILFSLKIAFADQCELPWVQRGPVKLSRKLFCTGINLLDLQTCHPAGMNCQNA